MDTATRTGGWTRADLDRFPQDGHRRELVDGHLLVSPLARRRHQLVVGRIYYALEAWSRKHHGVAYPGANVDLDATTHLEPDVCWDTDTDASGIGFSRVPALVVEVGSPSTHRYDRGVKRERYLTAGAREVWLVDLARDEIEVHRRLDEQPVVLGGGDVLTTPVLPGFAADVEELLGRPAEG